MKTYVLCTTLDQDAIDTLKKVKDKIDLKNSVIYIVTVFEIHVYNVDFTPYVYPSEAQHAAIEKSAKNVMDMLATSLDIPKHNVSTKCLFDYSREDKIQEFLTEVKADLVVTATRGKHGIAGFFSSSFTDYLCKFSPCDVLVMRPAKT